MNLYRNNLTIGDIPQLDVGVPSFFPKTGLVAYYKLDESSGNAVDSSGNGKTLTNNNTTTYASGKINNGANFVKTSTQWLSRSYDSDLNIGNNDFTICGWLNLNATSGLFDIMGMGWDETTANILYVIRYDFTTNNLIFEWHDGAYKKLSVPLTASQNTWYFFTARRSGSTLYLSVNNGTPTTATPTFKTTSAGTFGIGRGGGGSSAYMNGLIDEVGIWLRDLTSDERTQLYNNGNGLTY